MRTAEHRPAVRPLENPALACDVLDLVRDAHDRIEGQAMTGYALVECVRLRRGRVWHISAGREYVGPDTDTTEVAWCGADPGATRGGRLTAQIVSDPNPAGPPPARETVRTGR